MQRNQRPRDSVHSSSSVTQSSALQSDLARKYKISDSMPTRLRKRVDTGGGQVARKIICRSCTLANDANSTVCACCGYFLLCVQEPQPTRAQEMGLVEKPTKVEVVSLGEWEAIEQRAVQRDESHCPICMIGFNQGSEVLLSCSHVFHRACLAAFEKMAQSQVSRNCPICRALNYQKKMTTCGSRSFSIVCIIKIQATFRQFVVKRDYRAKLREHYQQGNGSEERRRVFYERELVTLSDAVGVHTEQRTLVLNKVISSIDRTLSESRQLDAIFDCMLAQRLALSNASIGNGIVVENEGGQEIGASASASASASAGAATEAVDGHDNAPLWASLISSAAARGWHECPICMGPMSSSGRQRQLPAHQRRSVILSCSHVFHSKCIESFETFVPNKMNHVCPVCRCLYQKHEFCLDAVVGSLWA